MRRAAILLSAALLLLLLAMALKGAPLSLPDVPRRAAAGQFDTARALARLQRILGDRRPHPVDSAANDEVRERLVAELAGLGLRPAVTDDFVCNGPEKSRAISCARIRNVLATIGPAGGRQVLLVSHYDSTPVGPGASDDGIGVAAMLEIAALLKDRPLKRPITFLFDEGEESGLIGARAFLARNPLAAKVNALINLESRGVTGPAIMFETSRPNGAAIAAYARAAVRPVANSLTTDFYKLIPNSTDVAVFGERDWTILNFAVIGNETRYHSPGDTLAALDPRSVRHMGEQALAAAGELANGPGGTPGSRLYADLLGRTLVVIPASGGFAVLALLLLCFGWLGWRRRAGLGRAAGAVAAALLGSAGLSFAAQALLGLLRAGDWWRAFPLVTGVAVYMTAIAASILAIQRLARPLARDRLRTAFWLIFLILGGAICLVAPGAAIFFLLSPLVAAAGMAMERRLPGAERIAALLAWLLLALSWAPFLHLTEILLDFDGAWIFAPLAAIILLPALIELKPLLARLPRNAVAVSLAAAVLMGWAATLFAPAYSADRKQQLSLEYVWNGTDRKAQWMVFHDGAPLPGALAAAGPWKHGVEVPWSTRKRWAAKAPPTPLDAPVLERLAERRTASGRWVSLRLHSRGAEVVRLRAGPEARLLAAGIASPARSFGRGETGDEDFVLRCHGRSCDGARVDLLIASPRPIEMIVMGVRSGLPASARSLVAARPANAAPQYSTDSSIALRRVRL